MKTIRSIKWMAVICLVAVLPAAVGPAAGPPPPPVPTPTPVPEDVPQVQVDTNQSGWGDSWRGGAWDFAKHEGTDELITRTSQALQHVGKPATNFRSAVWLTSKGVKSAYKVTHVTRWVRRGGKGLSVIGWVFSIGDVVDHVGDHVHGWDPVDWNWDGMGVALFDEVGEMGFAFAGGAGGAALGGLIGGLIGGFFGTVTVPGFGTITGAGVGGVTGAFAGGIGGAYAGEEFWHYLTAHGLRDWEIATVRDHIRMMNIRRSQMNLPPIPHPQPPRPPTHTHNPRTGRDW